MALMTRRELLRGLAAGGLMVAGELWFPGKKVISIPSRWTTFEGMPPSPNQSTYLLPNCKIVDDDYVGWFIVLDDGTKQDVREITAYQGSSKTLTISYRGGGLYAGLCPGDPTPIKLIPKYMG